MMAAWSAPHSGQMLSERVSVGLSPQSHSTTTHSGHHLRRRLLLTVEYLREPLAGRVIKVGGGSETNFLYYPASIERVMAIEAESPPAPEVCRQVCHTT